MADSPDILMSEGLAGFPHGFSTKDTDPLLESHAARPMVRVKQVHSADVVTVGARIGWEDGSRPEADALVTNARGIMLGIVTADCAPVLLADRGADVVAAAHAGWRGAHGGILRNTVAAMCALGARPAHIAAVIGPTIAQDSYEVDDRFRTQFGAGDARFFVPGRRGHQQFDLPAYVTAQLEAAGVGMVRDVGEDTYTQPGRFHSYRRAVHLGEDTQVRHYSVIGLPDAA